MKAEPQSICDAPTTPAVEPSRVMKLSLSRETVKRFIASDGVPRVYAATGTYSGECDPTCTGGCGGTNDTLTECGVCFQTYCC